MDYAIIPANVRYDKSIAMGARLLYGEIAALCVEKGFCCATNKYFSTLYEVTEKTIKDWLSALVQNGYLYREIQYEADGKTVARRILRIDQINISDFPEVGIKTCSPSEEIVTYNNIDNINILNNNINNNKINKNNISLSLEEIKELQKTTLSLVDKVNKVMDITRIESSDYSIKERKYQTSNLIDNIKGILEKNNKEVNYEISTLPKVLYGSDTNIVQTFSYLVDFISKNFENYTLSIKISNLLVRNKCHLKFSLVVDSKYNNLDMYEKDNKYTLSNKSIEYEIYEKLIDLQRGHNFISKDGSKVIFEFSLYQRQEEVKEINDNEEIEYFDASDKNVLVALNSHNDIRNLSELLMNYNVNITTAGSVNELNELLSSNKTFDLVFLSDHIYGIDNYDIKNTNDFKKTINKLSLVAGYKLEIVLVTLNDYQKENIEYLTLPISKTKLDDILVKYLNED
nr:MAG TPA: helix-turn-helix domain protein [Caudoviricetes sp.]